jgi:hypothetical protein
MLLGLETKTKMKTKKQTRATTWISQSKATQRMSQDNRDDDTSSEFSYTRHERAERSRVAPSLRPSTHQRAVWRVGPLMARVSRNTTAHSTTQSLSYAAGQFGADLCPLLFFLLALQPRLAPRSPPAGTTRATSLPRRADTRRSLAIYDYLI